MRPSADTLEDRDGCVVSVTRENAETGWRVLAVDVTRNAPPEVWVGVVQPVGRSMRIKASGIAETHPRFGPQFKVASLSIVLPTSPDGIRRFLRSGIFPGLDPAMADRIVDHLGGTTFAVLTHDPIRLDAIPGLPRDAKDAIITGWREHRDVGPVVALLGQHGVARSVAMRIARRFPGEALATVKARPYQLAMDADGIGFHAADAIGLACKLSPHVPERGAAGMVHVLREIATLGHVYTERDRLVASVADLLGWTLDATDVVVDALVRSGHVHLERLPSGDDAVYPRTIHRAEATVARRLRELLAAPVARGGALEAVEALVAPAIARFEASAGIGLAPAQRAAVELAARAKVLVVTGGPGTGKTSTLRAMLALFDAACLSVKMAAPTGRAAKRMSETTGREAVTLHRLLEYGAGRFQRDRAHPMTGDVFVVDEASMIDVVLAAALLDAVPDGARLVIVGDVDQLPSIGPGAVLRDVIASEAIPVARLTAIFRQAAGSLIVENAHRIQRGDMPVTNNDPVADFQILERRDPSSAADAIVATVIRDMPRRFGLDPRTEIQVLVPMHGGPAGTGSLNARLQAALNPSRSGPEIRRGEVTFRVGDRVTQLRNSHDRGASNGDVGFILKIDPSSTTAALVVTYGDRDVSYSTGEIGQLALAYAVTIHRSQGSEYPGVVVAVLREHTRLLSRNLIYTGATRGKTAVVLVADPDALRTALSETRWEHRRTRLRERLRGEV